MITDEEIARLVAAHPLPDGVPDATLNKREVADFFGVSPPTIDSWISAGLPAISEGTNGRSWEFRASIVWAWKQARDADDIRRSAEAEAAITQMRLRIIGGKAGNSIQALSPKDRQQIYAIEAEHTRLQRERNISLLRDDVQEAFEDLLSLVRDSINAYPDRLEREAGLSGKAVEKVTEYGDALLDQLERKIADFFAARPVDDRQAHHDLFEQ